MGIQNTSAELREAVKAFEAPPCAEGFRAIPSIGDLGFSVEGSKAPLASCCLLFVGSSVWAPSLLLLESLLPHLLLQAHGVEVPFRLAFGAKVCCRAPMERFVQVCVCPMTCVKCSFGRARCSQCRVQKRLRSHRRFGANTTRAPLVRTMVACPLSRFAKRESALTYVGRSPCAGLCPQRAPPVFGSATQRTTVRWTDLQL